VAKALLCYLEAIWDSARTTWRTASPIDDGEAAAMYLAWPDRRGGGLHDLFTLFLARAIVAFDDGATLGKPDTAHVRRYVGIPPAPPRRARVMRTALAAP